MTTRTQACPWTAFALAVLLLLGSSASAAPHSSSNAGGSAFEQPDVSALRCDTGTNGSCSRGQELRLSGEGLATTQTVTFLGSRGSKDDRKARPQQASPHRVIVAIPREARTGPVKVQTASATATGPRLRVLAASPAPTPASAGPELNAAVEGVFPIRGKHSYGTAINRFGGVRGHQGQDVFASCGTPLVAAMSGTVLIAKFQARAGNYLVIKAGDGTSQAYMHMAGPAAVAKGEQVAAGQAIGDVGQTGHADGCHLHFELWNGAWQAGGTAVDPLAALKRWDAAS